MSDISTTLAGIPLAGPTVLASGVLGISASSAGLAARAGAGAVTLKSCGFEPREGHPCPAVLPFGHGLINAIGLANPGVDEMAAEIAEFKRRFQTPVFASVFGRSEGEFARVARRIAEAGPDLIEVNVSCPNVESELGTPFGLDPEATARITRQVKDAAGSIPVAVKLSPQAHRIGELAPRCQDAGADAICAINTVGPGMVIDVDVRRPVLANRVGGLSGPAILPIAVRCVYEIASRVTIPIIGTGGVACASDALQLILAGATALGIGSGIHEQGLELFEAVHQGIREYLDAHGLPSLEAIRGAAHG